MAQGATIDATNESAKLASSRVTEAARSGAESAQTTLATANRGGADLAAFWLKVMQEQTEQLTSTMTGDMLNTRTGKSTRPAEAARPDCPNRCLTASRHRMPQGGQAARRSELRSTTWSTCSAPTNLVIPALPDRS